MYSERVVYRGVWNKIVVVVREDDDETMLDHADPGPAALADVDVRAWIPERWSELTCEQQPRTQASLGPQRAATRLTAQTAPSSSVHCVVL